MEANLQDEAKAIIKQELHQYKLYMMVEALKDLKRCEDELESIKEIIKDIEGITELTTDCVCDHCDVEPCC